MTLLLATWLSRWPPRLPTIGLHPSDSSATQTVQTHPHSPSLRRTLTRAKLCSHIQQVRAICATLKSNNMSVPQLWKKVYLFLSSISQGGDKKFRTAWFVAMQIFIFHFLPRIFRVAHKSPYFNVVKANSPHIISQIDIDEQISQQWLNGCYCRVIFYQLSMLTAPTPLQNPVPNKNEHVCPLYTPLFFFL